MDKSTTNLWLLPYFNGQIHSKSKGSTTVWLTNTGQIFCGQICNKLYHTLMDKSAADPWNQPCLKGQIHKRSLGFTTFPLTNPQQISGFYHTPIGKSTAHPSWSSGPVETDWLWSWGVGITKLQTRLVIERLQVQVPAGAMGKFSSPGSTFCVDSFQYLFHQCYCSST